MFRGKKLQYRIRVSALSCGVLTCSVIGWQKAEGLRRRAALRCWAIQVSVRGESRSRQVSGKQTHMVKLTGGKRHSQPVIRGKIGRTRVEKGSGRNISANGYERRITNRRVF